MTDPADAAPEIRRPDVLVRLLGSGSSPASFWDLSEWAGVFEAQLDGVIELDLIELGEPEARLAGRLGEKAVPAIHTFRDLFQHPSPPLDLLRMVKEWAQTLSLQPEPPLPQPMLLCLYCLSIRQARRVWQTSISTLSDSELAERFRWLSGQPWVTDRVKQLFSAGGAAQGG